MKSSHRMAATMDLRLWLSQVLIIIAFAVTVTVLANDDALRQDDIASISSKSSISLTTGLLASAPSASSLTSSKRNLRQVAFDSNYVYHDIVPPRTLITTNFNGVERNSTDNRKPAFRGCKDYAPSVKEEQPSNTFVIKVEADDPDDYDTITYSFEKSATERAKFRINSKTGEIVTSYTFDRDEPIREKEVCLFSSLIKLKQHLFFCKLG